MSNEMNKESLKKAMRSQLVNRYSHIASYIRSQGHTANVNTCRNVNNTLWVTENLENGSLSLGDYALLSEYSPEQWQRDCAARHLNTVRH